MMFESSLSFSQDFSSEAIYKVTISKSFNLVNDSILKTYPKERSSVLRNILTKTSNSVKSNIQFIENILIFNNYEASYKKSESLDSDLNETVIITGSYGLYYYNKRTNEKIRQTEAYGQLFLISSKLNERKWVLTQDSKTISGYLCYKATSTLVTRNSKGTFYKPITAWYAPKLSVPYGPKGYGGLPGLILQLTEGDFTFYVSKLTLNPKKAIKIKIPTKGKKVTQKEFEKIGKESSLNFVKMRN